MRVAAWKHRYRRSFLLVMVHKEVNCKTWLLQHHIFHILVTHCKINFLKMRIFVMVTHTSLISSGVTGAACGLSPYGNQTPSRWLRCLFESHRGEGFPRGRQRCWDSCQSWRLWWRLSTFPCCDPSLGHDALLFCSSEISSPAASFPTDHFYCSVNLNQVRKVHLCTWTYVQHFWFPKISWWYTNLH